MSKPGPKLSLLEELEHHVHNTQLLAGDDGSNGFEDSGLDAWQLTTGVADTFGSEVQIYSGALGSGIYMDIDKVFVTTASDVDSTYVVELWAGSGTFGEATRMGGIYYRRASNLAEEFPTLGKSPRIRGDLKVWARAKCEGATETIDFLLEYHIYPPPDGDEIDS